MIVVNVFIFVYNNKRSLNITNFELSGVKEVLNLEENYYENQFTESFIHNFSSAYARFNVENHTNDNIEIYEFYLEIKLDNVDEPILVPLDAYTRREQQRIEVFLSDWDAVWDIDVYTVKANTSVEILVSLSDTCKDLSHIWFHNFGWGNYDTDVSKKLQQVYSQNKNIKCTCRIVCKDTFGNYYYSSKITYKFIPQ